MDTEKKDGKVLGLFMMLAAGYWGWKMWKEESEEKVASALGFYNPRLALPSVDGLGDSERKIQALANSFSPGEIFAVAP